MDSFIGWVGGKRALRKYIIPMIPEDATRYIEVCGVKTVTGDFFIIYLSCVVCFLMRPAKPQRRLFRLLLPLH